VSPRPSIADERRPQILDAAARVIAARGFDGLRLSDVAEEGGFSVGTVQHYFGSREALLDGAFRQMQASSLRRWYVVAGREPDPWRRLTSLFESASIDNDRFRERWTLWLEFWTMCLRDAAMRRDSGDLHGAWQAPLREAIESGIAAGRFDPRCSIDDVVDRALALMDGLALQLLLEIPGSTRDRMRDLIIDAIAADLGVDPSTGEPVVAAEVDGAAADGPAVPVDGAAA
jgi:AcrR family transcriptional regulator